MNGNISLYSLGEKLYRMIFILQISLNFIACFIISTAEIVGQSISWLKVLLMDMMERLKI